MTPVAISCHRVHPPASRMHAAGNTFQEITSAFQASLQSLLHVVPVLALYVCMSLTPTRERSLPLTIPLVQTMPGSGQMT